MKPVTVFILCITLKFVSSKSFTLVIDTSGSMQNDIIDIQRNIKSVLDAVRGRPHIQNYILVPFSDSGTATPVIVNNSDSFFNAINTLTASGISDCPENTLAGVRRALEVSYSESYIYVFTDASAKDYHELSTIKNLCENTRSQVTMLLSGYCRPEEGSSEVYKDVARYCSGTTIQFDSRNFIKAFQYMTEMATVEWTKVVTYSPIHDRFDFEFSVTSLTGDMVLVATGVKPWILIDGQNGNDGRVIHDRKSLMAVYVKTEVGTYKATVRCETCTTVAVYQRNILPYYYGFSRRLVKNIKETSLKPIPDTTNFLLIISSMSIYSVRMETFDGRPGVDLTMEPVPDRAGMYFARIYVSTTARFRLLICSYDSRTSEKSIGSTKILEAQKSDDTPLPSSPVIEIILPDSTLVELGATITIASRITAFPKPDIWWENAEGQTLSSEDEILEIPSVYISYVTIENVVSNGTIFCKWRNSESEGSQSVDIFVNRTAFLEVEQSPADETIEYGSVGKLYCKVNSYPEGTINWYHNGSLVENSEDVAVIPEDNALLIKSMRLEDVGEYRCEVSNSIESKSLSAFVSISGLEPPELELDKSEIDLKPEDSVEISCRVNRGSPKPTITWLFKSEDAEDFSVVPDEVEVDEEVLSISSVKVDHAGTYKCEGLNAAGEDSRDVVIRIRYPPAISDSEDNAINVIELHEAKLSCQVDAKPKARVWWEMILRDEIMPLDDRHSTDEENTHRFFALWKDTGNYRCTAENELGRAEKTVTVNVLVRPHIQEPPSERLTVRAGETVNLTCYVTHGNPVPTTRWEFTGTNSMPVVLSRGNATNVLRLSYVTKAQEGLYLCAAENSIYTDTISIRLTVY